jgi:hypothetical protein
MKTICALAAFDHWRKLQGGMKRIIKSELIFCKMLVDVRKINKVVLHTPNLQKKTPPLGRVLNTSFAVYKTCLRLRRAPVRPSNPMPIRAMISDSGTV